jgi:hypothetical protein
MNAKSKTPNAAGTGLVLAATAGCLVMISCANPEAFKLPVAADRSPAAPFDGGTDSKTSGGGGSFVAAGGTGGANVAGTGGRPDGGTGGGQAGNRGGGQAGSMGGATGQAEVGTGGGAGQPDGSETTGSGGSVSPTGTGGMVGAAGGTSGAAPVSSGGSSAGATGGSQTGGNATGGRGGAEGTGGSPAATGPCASLCTSPTVITLPHAAANLGSDATCEEAKGAIEGGNCGNFVSPRTFKVNGVTVPCTTADWTKIPPLRNGGYCFQASAGSHTYAYFVTF